ncbi:MAG: hypothetical protein HZB61_15620 [Nitrospirae bacterium]|nr:hypothetical protein [Nitrospirota bacterium]
MNLQELKEEIKKICVKCIECDPCCTGNILKKCIENNRFTPLTDDQVVIGTLTQ